MKIIFKNLKKWPKNGQKRAHFDVKNRHFLSLMSKNAKKRCFSNNFEYFLGFLGHFWPFLTPFFGFWKIKYQKIILYINFSIFVDKPGRLFDEKRALFWSNLSKKTKKAQFFAKKFYKIFIFLIKKRPFLRSKRGLFWPFFGPVGPILTPPKRQSGSRIPPLFWTDLSEKWRGGQNRPLKNDANLMFFYYNFFHEIIAFFQKVTLFPYFSGSSRFSTFSKKCEKLSLFWADWQKKGKKGVQIWPFLTPFLATLRPFFDPKWRFGPNRAKKMQGKAEGAKKVRFLTKIE